MYKYDFVMNRRPPELTRTSTRFPYKAAFPERMGAGQKNIAEPGEVKLGEFQGGNWIVRSGLKAGDRVIVSGLQKLQPGKPIRIAKSKATSKRGAQPQQER